MLIIDEYCIYIFSIVNFIVQSTMSLLFLNFSTDQICIKTAQSNILLAHKHSEYDIPAMCKTLIDEQNITDIVMLNGPGGFTSLRIGSLVCSMIKKLYPGHITLYDISKPSIYRLAISILSDNIVMWIGQQKNYRLYRLSEDTYETIQDISPYGMMDVMYGSWHQAYLDRMIDIGVVDNMLDIRYQGSKQWLSLIDLQVYQTDIIQARYYILPAITPKIVSSF